MKVSRFIRLTADIRLIRRWVKNISFNFDFRTPTDTVNEDELDFFNEVAPDNEVKDDHNDYLENANKLREKHRDLKDTFDDLERKTSQGRNRREFVDPKVINLWNTALQNNFTASELAALKVHNAYLIFVLLLIYSLK